MKKLLYIANIRLPTEKAHGVQIMEMASAFSGQGIEVELIVPRRKNNTPIDPFDFYQIPRTFTITRLFTWDLVSLGHVGYLVESWTFFIAALFYSLRKGDVIAYSRDELVLFLLSFFGKRYVFEPHSAKWNLPVRTATKRAVLIVPITQGLKDFYVNKGVPEGRMLVASDGVNLNRFSVDIDKAKSREKLGLPQDKTIVLYSGHLYQRKGAQVLAASTQQLSKNVLVVFVGGTEKDIAAFRREYGAHARIIIVGHKPHTEIPYYLRAADILVLPNSATSDDARLYTSPMKLFEYMASGTPIVASDVPSLREVLSEKFARFFTPDDPIHLAEVITRMVESGKQKLELGQMAKHEVENYTWEKRAEHVVGAIDALVE